MISASAVACGPRAHEVLGVLGRPTAAASSSPSPAPLEAEAAAARALLAAAQGDRAATTQAIARLHALDGDRASAWVASARAWAALGDAGAALSDADQALRLDPGAEGAACVAAKAARQLRAVDLVPRALACASPSALAAAWQDTGAPALLERWRAISLAPNEAGARADALSAAGLSRDALDDHAAAYAHVPSAARLSAWAADAARACAEPMPSPGALPVGPADDPTWAAAVADAAAAVAGCRRGG